MAYLLLHDNACATKNQKEVVMHKVLSLIAVVHFVFIGCNVAPTPTKIQVDNQVSNASPAEPVESTEALLTFMHGQDEISIMSYDLDSLNHEVEFSILRVPPNGDSTSYTLVVKETHIEESVTHNAAMLRDVQGNFLVGIEYAWPAYDSNPNWFSVTECTAQDRLEIVHLDEGSSITERYTLNGQQKAFIYMEPAANMARLAPSEDQDPMPPLRENVARELAQWEALISPQNTLNNNENGELLVGVLSNESFAAWIDQQSDELELGRVTYSPRNKVCLIADIGAIIKCHFLGGWMNFLCVASWGIAIACIIGGIGCWIHGGSCD